MEDAEAIARVHVAAWRAAYAGVVPDRYLVAMSQAGQARQWRRLLGPSRARETVLVAEALLDGAGRSWVSATAVRCDPAA